MKKEKKIRFSIILLFAFLLFSFGCSAKEFNRQLEDALGSAARTKIQTLGSPGKECALVKLNISNSYATVLPRKILRLGEEYQTVRVVSQFSSGSTDYAVLECGEAGWPSKNFLLKITSTNMTLYDLESTSSHPFSAMRNTRNGDVYLTQSTGTSGQQRVWTISANTIWGPEVVSAGAKGKKTANAAKGKTGTQKKQSQPPNPGPLLKPDTSARIEDDIPAAKPQEPAVAVPKPETGSQPAGGNASPYTIVID